MTKTEAEQRIQYLFNRLTVMNLFEESLIEKIGRHGYQAQVDEVLDEINELRKWLKMLNQ